MINILFIQILSIQYLVFHQKSINDIKLNIYPITSYRGDQFFNKIQNSNK